MEKTRIFGLDLLRVKAIGLIVLAQCIWIFPTANPLLTQAASVFHFIGVEIFLVLSGFLLYLELYPCYVNGNFDKKALLSFLKRKMLLILPLYYLVLLVNILMAGLWNLHPAGLWKYFCFLQFFAMPSGTFFADSWLIAVLLFAGLLFPVTLYAANCIFKPLKRTTFFRNTTLLLIILFLLMKTVYHFTTTNTAILQWDASLRPIVIYRLDSVFIGVLTGWMMYRFSGFFEKFKFFFVIAGFLGVLFLFAGVGYFQLLIDTHKLFWNVVYLPLTALIICCFLPLLYNWKSATPLLKIPVTFGSKIAYAIYLLHFNVILTVLQWYFPINVGNPISIFVMISLYVLLTTFMASMLWLYYQRRFIKHL